MTIERLASFDGQLYILLGSPDRRIYVEPLKNFLARTPADKDRALKAAIKRATEPSTTTVH